MIRVKKWATKKTKVHVTYEFDHDRTIHEKTTTFAIKDFNVIDKRTLYIRVRGLVLAERHRLDNLTKEKMEEPEEE